MLQAEILNRMNKDS